MTTSRRKFIQSAAQGGLSAAALTAFPPSIRKALAIPAHNETGTIKDVKHVVVLMQENRAFDHYFGTLKGVRGFGDRFTIPQPGGRSRRQGDGSYRFVNAAPGAHRILWRDPLTRTQSGWARWVIEL